MYLLEENVVTHTVEGLLKIIEADVNIFPEFAGFLYQDVITEKCLTSSQATSKSKLFWADATFTEVNDLCDPELQKKFQTVVCSFWEV